MKPTTKWLLLGGAVAAAAFLVVLGLNRTPPIQNFTAKVERGDIHDVVEATGTINAVITVQVGSQVSGTISKLFVDFNSRVHKSGKSPSSAGSNEGRLRPRGRTYQSRNHEPAATGHGESQLRFRECSSGGRAGQRDAGGSASQPEGSGARGGADQSQLHGDSLAD